MRQAEALANEQIASAYRGVPTYDAHCEVPSESGEFATNNTIFCRNYASRARQDIQPHITNGCQTSLNENRLNNLFHIDIYGPETRPTVSNYTHSNINNPVLFNSDTRSVNNVDLCDTGVNPMANTSMSGLFGQRRI